MRKSVSSAAEALAQQAAADPEDPWLFHRPDLDWRWCSWSRAARAVAAAEPALATLPQKARVALPDRLHPDAIAWCLAIYSCGLVAIPLPEDELRENPLTTLRAAGCAAWVDDVGGPALLTSSGEPIKHLALPPIPGPFEKDLSPPSPSAASSRSPRQGSVVLGRQADVREEVPFQDLVARAEASFVGLPSRSAGTSRKDSSRDIVVLTGSLADPAVQLLLIWSLTSEAALLLEPDLSAYAPTVEWARPTLLAGPAEALASLHKRLGPKKASPRKTWRRRSQGPLAKPLDRVRAVVILEGGEPDKGIAGKWRELGVRVLPI